nr:MAG TPA: hypothetical protein [Caudoviricetes sp.]
MINIKIIIYEIIAFSHLKCIKFHEIIQLFAKNILTFIYK